MRSANMRLPTPRALLLLWVLPLTACSPTDLELKPGLHGPDEVTGVWLNFMIVCTVPITMTASRPIAITSGKLTSTFPAEGRPKARIFHDFTPEELEGLWGTSTRGRITRSLEIVPGIQHEDYRVVVEFTYQGWNQRGTLTHIYRCRPDPTTPAF